MRHQHGQGHAVCDLEDANLAIDTVLVPLNPEGMVIFPVHDVQRIQCGFSYSNEAGRGIANGAVRGK